MNRSLSVSGDNQVPRLGRVQISAAEEPWISRLIFSPRSQPGLAKWRSFAVEGRVVPSYVFIGPRGGACSNSPRACLQVSNPERFAQHQCDRQAVGGPQSGSAFGAGFRLVWLPGRQSAARFRPFLRISRSISGRCASDPVIRYFEQELTDNQLDGIIAVKANEPIAGFQIQVSSRVIATEVLWPVLELVQRLVPLASEPIQIFPAAAK